MEVKPGLLFDALVYQIVLYVDTLSVFLIHYDNIQPLTISIHFPPFVSARSDSAVAYDKYRVSIISCKEKICQM